MKIAIVIGNRPHFIKCAPLLKALEPFDNVETFIIHSGQHYDHDMSDAFLKGFNFPPITENLAVGSGSSSVQTAKILMGLEPVLRKHQPDCLINMGDTNTTLAAALAAYQMHIPSAHIEAGMRENIWRPEEINKKMADHCADFLFAPIPRAVENLHDEGIDPKRIFLTGDITYDTYSTNCEIAFERFDTVKARLNTPHHYDLMTLHRAETVDNRETLQEILQALAQWPNSIVFPVHPRTAARIQAFELESCFEKNPHIIRVQPLPYLDFLTLLTHAFRILTDSSGVLKEAFYAQKLCLVLDDTSEYKEIFQLGAALMGGRTTGGILEKLELMGNRRFPAIPDNPFGRGDAAKKMVNVLTTRL